MGRLSYGLSLLCLAGMLAFVALAAGCSAPPAVPASARVAQAAAQSEAFYREEVKAFRFRIHILMRGRDPENFGAGATSLHESVQEGAVVAPDRATLRIENYVIPEGDVQRKRPAGDCGLSEAMVIGTQEYQRECGGPWVVTQREEPPEFDMWGLEQRFETLKSLVNVERTGSAVVHDAGVDVFQGEFTDSKGKRHRVTVWIGKEDDLVRRYKDERDGNSVQIEHYDINGSITIEPPQ